MGVLRQLVSNLRTWLQNIGVASVPTPVPLPVPTPAPTPTPTPTAPDPLEQLLAAHNAARQQAGIGALAINQDLQNDAGKHAAWMAANKDMTHTGADGDFATRIRAAGYTFSTAGENIAMGQPDVTSVMTAWMNSSGHRQNILNADFIQCGFGVASDGQYLYWCAVFAAPLDASHMHALLRDNLPRTVILPRGLVAMAVPLGYVQPSR